MLYFLDARLFSLVISTRLHTIESNVTMPSPSIYSTSLSLVSHLRNSVAGRRQGRGRAVPPRALAARRGSLPDQGRAPQADAHASGRGAAQGSCAENAEIVLKRSTRVREFCLQICVFREMQSQLLPPTAVKIQGHDILLFFKKRLVKICFLTIIAFTLDVYDCCPLIRRCASAPWAPARITRCLSRTGRTPA